MGSDADLLFGKIAVSERYLTQVQVEALIEAQELARAAGKPVTLGELAQRQGLMTAQKVQRALRLQEFTNLRAEGMRLGALAVRNGFVTSEQVQAALEDQEGQFKKMGKIPPPLGEILVAKAFLSAQQLDALLTAQKRLQIQGKAQGPQVEPTVRSSTPPPGADGVTPPPPSGERRGSGVATQPTAELPAEMLDIFQTAVANRASDVLITAGSPPVFRIDGALVAATLPPLKPDAAKYLVYSLLRKDQVRKFETNRNLDLAVTEGAHRFRANLYWQRDSVAACFRLIPDRVPSLQELGLPSSVEDLANAPQGLVLVSGPTGHGKSTTQAALIDIINSNRRAHIVTVEDPIEYIHPAKLAVIDQREVGQDTPSFAEGLRAVVRQSPDVILIGEMRDLDSISAALTVAETGHLVISTLHTNDSVQAIDRVVDVFPSHQQNQVRSQLSLCLLAVIAQRLIPRADGKGRVLAVEILKNVAAIGNLIREEKTQHIYTIMETSGRDGMKTMDHALKDLGLQGVISRQEARGRMRNPALLPER